MDVFRSEADSTITIKHDGHSGPAVISKYLGSDDVWMEMELDARVLVDFAAGARPVERGFGPCVKCSGTTIDVRYHAGKPHCSTCRTIDSCKHSSACGEEGTRGEHLVARCERCRYAWIEAITVKLSDTLLSG